MFIMEFKKLEIEPEGNWIKRKISNPHFKKTLIYILIGAVAGLGYFYLAEDKSFNEFTTGEILKSMALGGFFGFFITNSPCAKGRC